MTLIKFKAKYIVGEKLDLGDRIFTVIGYEYVPDRALRYILVHMDNGEAKWEDLYDFEITAFINK